MKKLKTVPKRLLSVLLALTLVAGLFTIIPVMQVAALDNGFDGICDLLEAVDGAVHVKGWAIDQNYPQTTCNIEVHVGSVMYTIRADKYRPDVEKAKNCTPYCGFDEKIPVQDNVTRTVAVYVKNSGRSGTNYTLIKQQDLDFSAKYKYDDWYVFLNFRCGYNYEHSTLEAKTSGTYKTQIATPDYSNPKQLWHIRFATKSGSHDYYTIQNVGTGEYLCTSSTSAGTACGVTTTSGTPGNNAKWFFHPYGTADGRINHFLLIPLYYWDWNATADGNVDQNVMFSHRDGGNGGLVMMQRLLSVPDYTSVRIQNLTNPQTHLSRYNSWLDYRVSGLGSDYYSKEIWEFDQRNVASTSYGTLYAYYLKNQATSEYLRYTSSSGSDSAGSISLGLSGQKWMLIGESLDSAMLVPVDGSSRTYAWSHTPINQTLPCLTVVDDKAEQAKDAKMYQIDGAISRYHRFVTAQQIVTGLGSFYSTIIPTNATSTALSLALDGSNNGVVIRGLASNSPAADQQWYFQNVGNNQFVIRSLANNKVLYRNSGNGLLQFGDYVNDNNHKWYIAKEGTRTSYKYSLVSASSTTENLTIAAMNITDESLAYLSKRTDYLTFNLTIGNTTAPVYGEDLGDLFFAYISPSGSDNCLYCDYEYEKKEPYLRTRTREKKQENYWRFDRHADGSYTITSCNLEESTVRLKKSLLDSNGEYVYSAATETITPGKLKPVSITTPGTWKFYRYVPKSSGTITFSSSGSVDTYGHIYDENFEQLNYNDDDGGNSQFKIEQAVTAGKTYYLACRLYSESNTGNFTVTLTGSDNAAVPASDLYAERWFIRQYGGAYKLESKRNGKVFYLDGSALKYNTNTGSYTASQMFDITKTDMTVDTAMPNVKMHLFDYGNKIDTYANSVLPFTASAYIDSPHEKHGKLTQPSVDGYSGDSITGYTIPEHTGDHTVTMRRRLVNNYPYVTNNGETNLSGWNGKSGSLDYLFNPNMGDANGFVKGTGGSQTSYDITASTVSYQSQHFDVESTKGLFQYNEKNGMYYYNSLLNSAYFQRSSDAYGNLKTSGNFQLYDYTTSMPAQGANAGFRYNSKSPDSGFNSVNGRHEFNGNFLPFNKTHEEGMVTYGDNNGDNNGGTGIRKDGFGLRPNATITNDYVTSGERVPVNYQLHSGETPKKIDFWFGMTMQCDFKMTSDGKYNGKDIVFEFQGDDDVWVYLDGVLVLDIGGTHGAKAGRINFANGEVEDPTGTSNLKELYNDAVNEAGSNGFTYNGQTINNSYINNNFSGNAFKANTKHRLDFFYMERAATASYCELQFNLPKGAVAVEKEVTGLDSDLTDPREYTFQVQNENGTALFDAAAAVNQTYSLEHADGTTEEKHLASDCTFKLKDGERAYFQDLENGQQYKVVELNVPSGMAQTATRKYYDSTTKAYTIPVAYNGEVLNVNTSADTILTFKNAVDPTSSIIVTKNVLDKDGNTVTDPAATYHFGLRVFQTNANGSVTDFGTKTISITGAGSKTVTGLPQGAEYELWEYVPDDNVNNYEQPTLTDSAKPGTTVTGRLVERGADPAANDVIKGTVSGNTVTVTNKMLPPKTVMVTFKYYDRKKVSGEPANIDERETAYSKSVAVNSYTDASGNINFAQILTDLGATGVNKAISNVVDEYSLFTAQSTAKSAMANKSFTWGDVDGYATSKITAQQATYHTNSKRQPILTVADQEKWVTYYQSGKEVDAENATFTDDDKVTNITVWLYNSPRKFTVNTHVPDGSTATGKTIKYEAYYNQRIGSYYGDAEEEEEYKAYCDLYSIPKTEYDARGTVTGETEHYTTSGAVKTFNNQDFSYWTDAATNGNILSTDLKYNYRVTQNLDLYANYGQAITKGVTSVSNGVDLFYDTSGAKKLRVNTIISPYGFKLGTNPDPGIKYAAAAYLIKNDSTQGTLTNEQLETVRTQIQNHLENLSLTNERTTSSLTVEGIGKVSLSITQLGNHYNLTNKNRLQFVASYPAPKQNRYVLALTALKYENGESSDNGWYVSGNYVSHQLKP